KSSYGKPSRFDSTAQQQLGEILVEQGFEIVTEEKPKVFGSNELYQRIVYINAADIRIDSSGSRMTIYPAGVYTWDKPPVAIVLCNKKINLIHFVEKVNAVIAA